MKKEIFEWLKAIVFALIIVGFLNIFVTTTMVYSTSMYPTLIEKDLLILKKTKDVERGDIVSCVYRKVSLDSRSDLVGLVDKEDIIGDVLVRIFPLNRIGFVE